MTRNAIRNWLRIEGVVRISIVCFAASAARIIASSSLDRRGRVTIERLRRESNRNGEKFATVRRGQRAAAGASKQRKYPQ